MNTLLWAVTGWAAVSILATPAILRLCRFMARCDPARDPIAVRTEVSAARRGQTLRVERRSGVAGRRRSDDAPRRRRSDSAPLLG